MKRTTLIAITMFLAICATGCASLDNAGYDSYTVRAVKNKDGKTDGYELDVKSGKEYADRGVAFQTSDKGASLQISESGTKAFKGQALAVKALTVLPVTGLQDLVGK